MTNTAFVRTRQSGVTWDEATLFKYLENPAKFIPGSRRRFGAL